MLWTGPNPHIDIQVVETHQSSPSNIDVDVALLSTFHFVRGFGCTNIVLTSRARKTMNFDRRGAKKMGI